MFLAKTMFAGEGCNGCGLCAKNCPRQAIRMSGKQNPRPYWTLKCEQCMRCAGYCPKAAVDCNSFLVLAFVVVFSAIPIESLIARALFDVFPQLSGFGQSVIVFLLYYAVVVSLAVLIYALLHLLGRIPAVNRVYTRLSFSHYWRKYRHADVPITTLTKR